MDNRPVGVYDSGLGGLTVWREIRRQLPEESLVYLGDGKNCPYGARPADEICRLKAVVGEKVLKVIIETCLLTDEEKIAMCKVVTDTGADFIKTSTGFSTAGATFADIELFAKHVGPNVKIKAAGGISTLEDAERFVALGASRLGTSRIIKLLKAGE